MHYDVIIIGTGAGGGTLAHRLAPVGQAHPDPRARRLRAAREGQLEPARRQRRGEVPHQGGVARRPTASRCIRTRTTTSAATRNSTARRCSACARGLRRAAPPRRRVAGVAHRLRRPRAVLHRGRAASTTCTASAATIPTEPSAQRPVPVSGGQPRAAHPAAARRPRARRAPAVPRAARRDARRAEAARPARASAATPATASRASCTPSPTRKSAASSRRSRHPNVTLLTGAYVSRLETSAVGTGGHARSHVDAQRRARRVYTGRRRRRRRCGAINSAALLLRSANDRHPHGPRQPLRRRRPPLHGPRQLGADGALALPEPDGVPEDAGA